DIVTSDATGIESRLARGAGFVIPPRAQIPSSIGATTIALGDVDGDGRLDAVIGESCGFMVMLGRGDGTFAEPNNPITCAPNPPSQIAVRDLDGDGRADIVFANQDSNTVSVCINACNNGYGSDGDFAWPLDFPGGTTASPILAVGDVNNDGLPD